MDRNRKPTDSVISPWARSRKKWKECGNSNCRCADSDHHGSHYYHSYTDPETGKTTTTYLAEDELPERRDRIRTVYEFKADLQELVELEAEQRRSK